MIRSMTGFGRAEKSAAKWRCSIELRSFNGRYLEVRLRLPPGLNHLDDALKKRIKIHCERGNVEGSVTLVPEGAEGVGLELNRPLMRSYRDLLQEVRKSLDQPVHVSLGDLLGNRELIQNKGWEDRSEELEELVRNTLDEAVRGMVSMRETEGRALKSILQDHTGNVRALVEEMMPLTKDLPDLYAKRLRENLARLSNGDLPGEERILQEITLFADRCDVSEEFARLHTHLDHLGQLLDVGGAVGRKSDFLLQELNREVNTLGVKCNDGRISTLVIDMKTEIEKIREQVQNIE